MSIKLYKLIVKGNIQKDFTLDMVKMIIEENELNMNYEKYMQPQIIWSTEDVRTLAAALAVKKVIPKGAYIMGLFGGEEKHGKERYAGLVLEKYGFCGNMVSLKLTGLSRDYEVPIQLLKQHRVNVYKLYYRGLINPFKCATYDILLSAAGDSELKEFLRKFIEFNRGNMLENDFRKIRGLIEELKVSFRMLDPHGHYVIYRCNRAFTAAVPTDLNNAISESHTAYIECENEKQAHYYAAALNYLAYKVIIEGRSFIRDQFTRPLIAIIAAKLSWRDVPDDIKNRVSSLSQNLSQKLRWRNYANQKEAILDIIHEPEFKEIIKILDDYVVQNVGNGILKHALDFVSTYKTDDTRVKKAKIEKLK